jgi:hypothetical protein
MSTDPYGTDQPSVVEVQDASTSGLAWLLKGFAYPCWSGSFYRQAARKRLILAVLFFTLFGLVFTIVGTARTAIAFNTVRAEIESAFQQGTFPTITIADGRASVEGQQPLVLFDEGRQFIAIDTSGTYREINTNKYSEGVLLTHNAVHVLSEDGYEQIPLSQLNELFGSPIVLDREGVLEIWSTIAAVLGIIVFLGLLLWHVLIRFVHIILFGLLVWGVAAMLQKETDFGPVLTTGLYATVPAMYLHTIFGLLGGVFPGLYSLLLLVIWGFALRAVLRDHAEAGPGGEESAMV